MSDYEKSRQSGHFTDSERKSIQQGAIRSAQRWLNWCDYVMQIQHLPTRLYKVIERHGYGGATSADVQRFSTGSRKQSDEILAELRRRKKIKSVSRGGVKKFVVPTAMQGHARINPKLK
jgi:hypothetical protein